MAEGRSSGFSGGGGFVRFSKDNNSADVASVPNRKNSKEEFIEQPEEHEDDGIPDHFLHISGIIGNIICKIKNRTQRIFHTAFCPALILVNFHIDTLNEEARGESQEARGVLEFKIKNQTEPRNLTPGLPDFRTPGLSIAHCLSINHYLLNEIRPFLIFKSLRNIVT